MSAAFQLPMEWDASSAEAAWQIEQSRSKQQSAARPELKLGKHD
jgi:hypothetical protein